MFQSYFLDHLLQADKKTLTLTETHADRDAQFEYINEQCKKANAEGIPVISIDAKKKESIGILEIVCTCSK
jgi:hypothetical protein